MLIRVRNVAGLLVGLVALFCAAAVPAWAAQSITMTWVRHAESTANAAGIIDTTVPGPVLTPVGETQAQAIGEALAPNLNDGIYVSDMIRTQLTAAPLEGLLGIPPIQIGGVREIAAGIYEGLPGTRGILYDVTNVLYGIAPAAWVLGARFVPTPFGEDGNMFAARTDDAIATVYASGDTDPVIFSHGATIQAWTLMNVVNPVLTLPTLKNTEFAVVTGNPEDGWVLQSWAGAPVSQTPDLFTKLFVDFRTWVVAPQTAAYHIGQALLYSNWYTGGSALTALLTAVRDGVVGLATATAEFVRAVIRDVTGALTSGSPAAVTPAVRPAGALTAAAARATQEPVADGPAPGGTETHKRPGRTHVVRGEVRRPPVPAPAAAVTAGTDSPEASAPRDWPVPAAGKGARSPSRATV